VQGQWSTEEKKLHINVLELRAVRLTFERLEAQLVSKYVLVESDNTTTVCYLNKQGGVHSRMLNLEATTFYQWLIAREIRIIAIHRRGVDNALADFLSRHRADSREWALCRPVVSKQFQLWGTPLIDLFASDRNCQVPMYCSMGADPAALKVDAFQLVWTGWEAFAFPPIALIQKTLNKVRAERASIVMVAPRWPRRPWYTDLLQLSCDVPRLLPIRQDLLSQQLPGKGTLFHEDLQTLHLVAWRLSGVPSVTKDFLTRLSRSCWPHVDRLRGGFTTPDGRLGSAGVIHGISIPLWPL
jgi:hypothetical protein